RGEPVGRRTDAVTGRRVARRSIVHVFVVSCSCVGALTAGVGSGAGDVDGEDHAHLAVPGDRAPPVEVLTDDADVEGGGFAGAESTAVGSAFEHEVMDVLVIGVLHVDDQSV